jgi:hypothetical protein
MKPASNQNGIGKERHHQKNFRGDRLRDAMIFARELLTSSIEGWGLASRLSDQQDHLPDMTTEA